MNTLLAVAVVIGSVTIPVGAITIASLRFVRKMMDDDTREERDAAAAAKEARKQAADAEQDKREQEEKAKRAAVTEEERKKKADAILKKLDALMDMEEEGESYSCLLCGRKSAQYHKGEWNEKAMADKGVDILDAALDDPVGTSHHANKTGPTTGVHVQTSRGPRIWQFCYRCGGMWLNRVKASTKRSKASTL